MATPDSVYEPEGPDGSALRRRELGQTSARSLLLTVLGEFVLPAGEPVWTRALLDVLGALGVEAKSARQALARTAGEGLLTSDRDGRRVRWSLTPAGSELLSDGAARIYGFGRPTTGWDGRWLVLLASVPESRRRLRHRLRTRLAWAGLGSPAPGVWVSPDPGKEARVAAVLDELDLTGSGYSFVGHYGGIGRADDIVAQAWDLDVVERAYSEFLDEFGPHLGPGASGRSEPGPAASGRSTTGHAASGPAASGPARAGAAASGHTAASTAAAADAGGGDDGDGVLARQVRLVHAWRRFPFLDPELPAELLPEHWAGSRATELFTTLHERWDAPARAAWADLARRA
ncbi:Phenylacetic acid degradation operon negative regulatory protein paaX [Pseudonocardia sp. Ae717_Ps2]|uniref:PaaX family transcriptional regulator n=1 Tax=Pseudonocardia sp. Ae717_Ps2 TaxID=1885573 RepID=UPI00095DEA40|nr:PaaX family transcriptional regulator C-terminal domain-containing protein [Pseudonocardia sp. Ae717_Ps2]OLM30815.1 Phenylacetic acid degradation operon negative regulatory protein paaX [Pseudonocardia sp. Ae717_Ps2]